MRSLYIRLSILLGVMVFLSCEKKTVEPGEEVVIDNRTTYLNDAKENQLRDDVWYYFKVLSLWQDNIPPTKYTELYKIQEDNYLRDNYTQYFEKAEDVMDYLTAQTPVDATTGKPIDRFSFLDRAGVVSGEIQDAVATSYGMYVFFLQTEEAYYNGNNAYLYVRMVDVGSPAYEAGIRRGDRLLSMNGRTDLDYNTQKTQDFAGINRELSSGSMLVEWRSTSGQEYRKRMDSEEYSLNPILSEKTFNINGREVGYLAFSSFVSVVTQTGLPSQMYNDFQQVFSNFQTKGINSLIVDLRYNGGGSVATAEYLINKLVPSSANNKQMYYYKVNKLLSQDWKWTRPDSAFAPVHIAKTGTLELDKVYFLVTGGTASASELLINSLKPYMDVQVVGTEKTYGKPVGFFPVEIGEDDEAEVYVTSFQMFNADGYGDYFGGLDLNKKAYEDYLKDFGDPNEELLANALYHLKNNVYAVDVLNKSASTTGAVRQMKPVKSEKAIGPLRAGDYGMFKFEQRK